MRIAATLFGAALSALLMLPVAAHAAHAPTKPLVTHHQQAFGKPDAASITGAPKMTQLDDESAPLTIKKRKKPQFQARFFGE